MIIACHQPNYIPHLGFFDKMKKADVFVLYDGVQFSDSFYVHRNRIRTENGWKWLTIPVERKMIPIKDIRIKNDALISKQPWRIYHWNLLEQSYKNTPYFKYYENTFKKIYLENEYEYLADFTIDLIRVFSSVTGIKPKIIRHSELNIEASDASERLAKITQKLGGTTYLSGPSGGSKYELKEHEFKKRGIALTFQDFNHPRYSQYHMQFDGSFEKNLSALDALSNTGVLPF